MTLAVSRYVAAAALALALVIGLMLANADTAVAGHANPILTADLDGRQEVETGARNNRIVGDPNGRGEVYVFGIDNDPTRQTLCYVLLVDRIAETELAPGGPRQAHIHLGDKGANGPVVVNLAWPQDGQSADCLTVGDTRAGNPVFVNGGNPSDIFAHPSSFYVNVHNGEYPAGAVRGQLRGR